MSTVTTAASEIGYDLKGAARVLGCSVSHIQKKLRERRIYALKSGKKLIIPGESLRDYVANLPRAEFKPLPTDRVAA